MTVQSVFSGPVRERVWVLDEDVELAEALPAERRDRAVLASRARVLRVEPGEWDPTADLEGLRRGHGLLVLSGLIVCRIGIIDHIGAELLGPGDLLRPLTRAGERATLPFAPTWRVLETLRLAVLDRAWSVRMHAAPEVGIALTGRAIRRSRRLANALVLASHPRLDERLLLLLWEVADRYGVVHPDGVHLRLPLTHEVLAELAAARRPSVSTALSRLAEAGAFERIGRDSWVLHGEPPAAHLGDIAGSGQRTM